jgi:hypothetical protein
MIIVLGEKRNVSLNASYLSSDEKTWIEKQILWPSKNCVVRLVEIFINNFKTLISFIT